LSCMRPPLSLGQSPAGMVMEPVSLSMAMHMLRGTLHGQCWEEREG
jgi:hypothetical protein